MKARYKMKAVLKILKVIYEIAEAITKNGYQKQYESEVTNENR
jgi:hypothetical protein